MPQETKICKNCDQAFTLSPDDFVFYEKTKVAPPRVCPNCQLQRRLAYRNERVLYSRKDQQTEKPIISIFSPDKPMPVYSQDVWWGDSWDPMDFGRDYDFSRPFFEQFSELITRTPWPALFNLNATNSEYCNYTTHNKNCYLVFGGDYNEDCAYSTFNMHTRDSMELYFVEKSELCYELTDSIDCYRVSFGQYVSKCSDSMFLYACNNCTNCLGCINLKNKEYCILNVQYTKGEYEQKVQELNLGNRMNLEKFKVQFNELKLRLPHKYAAIFNSEESTGDNLSNAKNCVNCFDVQEGAENCKNLFLAGWNLKDSRNSSTAGFNSELIYDSLGIFDGCSSIQHSYFINNSSNLWYSVVCSSSNDLFGCFGLRHKNFCILNKQYSQEEYTALVPKIIKQMSAMPYMGKEGYAYSFGDYFPIECSPFGYNESTAQEYFPLIKEQALTKGYAWKNEEVKERKITLSQDMTPQDIVSTPDTILNEVISCEHAGACEEQCTRAFKIIARELEFYRRFNHSIPHLCPNCRYYQRKKQRNPINLWKRSCHCGGPKSIDGKYSNESEHAHGSSPCSESFETTFAPERPEIIYCEQCYKAETV